MEQTSGDGGGNSVFDFDPTNKVIGVIDDPRDAKATLNDLKAAGPRDKVELLTNAAGARRIDVADEDRVVIHVLGPAEKVPAFYDAPVIARRVEQELQAGHYLIGVTANDGEERERAHAILKSHGGHFINFYGRWAAEALEP